MFTPSAVLRLVCVLVIGLYAATASAQEGRPPYGPDVTIDQAKKIGAGAIAHAKSKNWRVAVAVVDNHGFLVYFERMDDTQTASVEVAQDKARTASMYRRPSRVFEEVVVGKGRTAVLGLRGATPIIGGLPIMVDGKVIGGVGTSGVKSSEDEECSQAGLDAM